MAWTTPKDWTAGEMVTASLMTTYQRDNIDQTTPALANAKGDVFGATAANTLGLRTVGTNDHALSALASQATGLTTVAQGVISSGLVAPFTSACPSGWTEVTAMRGYFLVGVTATGTIGATVGTALATPTSPTHNHQYPSHTHTWSEQTNGATTGTASGGSSSPSDATTGTSGSSTLSDNLPYIQLTMCSKD
jgi:hypothetical protein